MDTSRPVGSLERVSFGELMGQSEATGGHFDPTEALAGIQVHR